MRKLFIVLAVLFVFHIPTQAQESYPVVEIFGGYSYFNSDQFAQRESLATPGFIASVAGNLTKNFGLVAEVSGHYGNLTIPGVFPDPQFDVHTFTYLFGPRLTARGGNFNVFGHVLFGGAKTTGESPLGSESDFALAVGAGVDINASKNIGVRLFQVDYLPIRGNDDTAHNFRISIGFTYRFAK
jgi:opacity protein-like surface antigen